MNELKGKTISRVLIAPDQGEIVFDTTDGPISFGVEGDCCSESWFSDIYNGDALLGTVASAEEIEMPDYNVEDGRTRQDVDSVYGYRITTDKGAATIAFRNSSNGYYGGYLKHPRVGSPAPETYLEIKGDWKA